MRALRYLPFAAVAVVHLLAQLIAGDGGNPEAVWSQVLLMPALALVLLSVPRAERNRAWPFRPRSRAGPAKPCWNLAG